MFGTRLRLIHAVRWLLLAAAFALASCDKPASQPSPVPRPDLPPLAPPAPGSVFPLRIEPGKPHLVDASGRPFMIVGDSAWSLLAQLSRAEIDAYLEDRRRRGYNAVLVNLIENHFSAHPPRNSEGEAPFGIPATFRSAEDYLRRVDYAAPNAKYFDLVDYLMARAAAKNLLVMAVPSYPGYLGAEQGWWVGMKNNGPAKMRAYGRFLGARYRGQRNILWVQGGDYDVPDKTLVREIAHGILEYDQEALHTFHGGRGTGAHDWMGGEAWLQLGNVYTAEVVYPAAQKHYAAHPGLPFILIEAYYEGAKPEPRLTRMQAYQALLSGATGQLSGHDLIWQFRDGWKQALDAPTSRSMTHLASLFQSRPWWRLRPDNEGQLLVGGAAEGVERAVAARADDGSFAIAYTPALRELAIDTTRLAGPRIQARWMDPLTGSFTVVPGSPLERQASQRFAPATPNSAGLHDWVLVLESSP